jgi:LysR family glycine cleavage system transcriptional activator
MNHFIYRTPPLDAIRGFVAVARRMSITLAAQDLFLTQSAVSRQIRTLEEYLGTPLFIRKHRAIEMTDVGEQLFALASTWFDRLIEFSETTRKDVHVRPVTITASIGVASLWILPKLGAFQALHPAIDVRLAANNRVLDLEEESIDLAIRYCREATTPHGSIRLFGEKIVPVANPAVAARAFTGHPDFRNEVLLELDMRALPWLRWSDWLVATHQADAKPRQYLHFNQYDQVIQAAIEGHGVALGRLALVMPMLADGRLVCQPQANVGISDLAYWLIKSEHPARAEVDIFAEWLIDEVHTTANYMESVLSPC